MLVPQLNITNTHKYSNKNFFNPYALSKFMNSGKNILNNYPQIPIYIPIQNDPFQITLFPRGFRHQQFSKNYQKQVHNKLEDLSQFQKLFPHLKYRNKMKQTMKQTRRHQLTQNYEMIPRTNIQQSIHKSLQNLFSRPQIENKYRILKKNPYLNVQYQVKRNPYSSNYNRFSGNTFEELRKNDSKLILNSKKNQNLNLSSTKQYSYKINLINKEPYVSSRKGQLMTKSSFKNKTYSLERKYLEDSRQQNRMEETLNINLNKNLYGYIYNEKEKNSIKKNKNYTQQQIEINHIKNQSLIKIQNQNQQFYQNLKYILEELKDRRNDCDIIKKSKPIKPSLKQLQKMKKENIKIRKDFLNQLNNVYENKKSQFSFQLLTK